MADEGLQLASTWVEWARTPSGYRLTGPDGEVWSLVDPDTQVESSPIRAGAD